MFCEEVAMELLNPEVNYKPEVKIRTPTKPKRKAELVISDKRKGTSAVDPYAEVKEYIRQPNRMVKPQTKEVMPEAKAKVEPQPKYKLFLVTNPKVMLDASTKVVDQTPKTRMPNQETKLKPESNQETEVILALPFKFKAAVRTVREAKEIIREAKSKDIPVVVREVKIVKNLKSGIKIESEGEPVSRLQDKPEVIKLRKPDGNILKSKEHVVISQPEQKSKLESKSVFQYLGKSVDEQKSQYKTKFIRQTDKVDNPKTETKIESKGKPNLKMISITQNIPRTKEAVISYLRNKSQFVAEPNLETISISPTSGTSGKDHKLKDVIKAGGDVKAELYVNRTYPKTMSEFKRHTDKADIPKPETKTDLKDKSNLQIISEFKDIPEVILQSQPEVRLQTKEAVICKPEKKPKLVTELNLKTVSLVPISIMPREKICVEVAAQTDSYYDYSNADVISEVKRQTNEANLRSEWILEDIEEGLWQEYKDKAKIKSIFQPSFHLIDEIQAKDKFNSDVTKKVYSYEDLVNQQHKEFVMSKLDNKSKLKAKLSAEMLSINQKVTKAFEEFKFLNESTHFYDYKLQLGGMSEVIRPTYGTKSKPKAVEKVLFRTKTISEFISLSRSDLTRSSREFIPEQYRKAESKTIMPVIQKPMLRKSKNFCEKKQKTQDVRDDLYNNKHKSKDIGQTYIPKSNASSSKDLIFNPNNKPDGMPQSKSEVKKQTKQPDDTSPVDEELKRKAKCVKFSDLVAKYSKPREPKKKLPIHEYPTYFASGNKTRTTDEMIEDWERYKIVRQANREDDERFLRECQDYKNDMRIVNEKLRQMSELLDKSLSHD